MTYNGLKVHSRPKSNGLDALLELPSSSTLTAQRVASRSSLQDLIPLWASRT